MQRFVILRHETPAGYPRPQHWDFMLQRGGTLRTWALEVEPQEGSSSVGELLSDHRVEYLDYEGPVSGGRGNVQRWDQGEFTLIEEGPDYVVVELAGIRLRGRVTIRRHGPKSTSWLFTFSDKPASADDAE